MTRSTGLPVTVVSVRPEVLRSRVPIRELLEVGVHALPERVLTQPCFHHANHGGTLLYAIGSNSSEISAGVFARARIGRVERSESSDMA